MSAAVEEPLNLTMPVDYWCPGCGIHNRSQDVYAQQHILMPECPVCADKRARGET